MLIKSYSDQIAGRWDEWVRRAPASTFCHLSGWLRVIRQTWGHESRSLYLECDGVVVGVLPLFLVKSRWPWPGSMLVSTPNAVYGGAVAEERRGVEVLQAAAQELARELRVDYLELRDAGLSEEVGDENFRRQDLYVSFDHPMTPDEDELMKSFPRDLRRMIRQGAKNGLSSEVGREELLDEFYEVYATSVRNLGTPVFPKRLFAGFLREFGDACDILIVRQGRRVAGGVLSFYFRGAVAPYYGGAYPEFYRAGVNNFMYWELMRRAAAGGCQKFDFGRSKRGSGAYEFKRGWGMTERALPYKFFLVRAAGTPNLNPNNPKFKLMIDVWKRLPLSVTKLIGPRVVKNIP